MCDESLGRRVRQARQAVEVESSLVLAEALGSRIGQARKAVEVEARVGVPLTSEVGARQLQVLRLGIGQPALLISL